MYSKIYFGRVRHRRLTPVEHEFSYGLFMLFIDLDELPGLFKSFWFWSTRGFNLAWFKREDHMGDPEQALSEVVRSRVELETGKRPTGPVRLLTNLRYFGYAMNPVSFYFCYEADGETVCALVAEVNNTPWGEQHSYVLDVFAQCQTNSNLRFENQKQFHVSPFMPLDMHYRWRVTTPGRHLNVHIENYQDGKKVFDATLQLTRQAVSHRSLTHALVSYPLVTLKVGAAIYYQAMRLWLKRVPFYGHAPAVSTSNHQD